MYNMYIHVPENEHKHVYKHVHCTVQICSVHEQFENEHKQIHQHIQYSTETCALICIRTCIRR